MSYDISNTWTVDLAWRYTSFGELASGGEQPFGSDQLTANEVVLGLRYNFWTW
jgi:opacity protein-like surface antigen